MLLVLNFLLSGLVVQNGFASSGAEPVTYASHIHQILQANCIGCHNPKGIAGFSLETYQTAKENASDILEQCMANKMPHGATARAECSPPGTFFGPSRLSSEQMQTVKDWVDHGTPSGNLLQIPAGPALVQKLDREPDLILENDSAGYSLPSGEQNGPSVRNIVRNFPIKVPFKEDHYIVGIKIIPDGGSLDPKVGLNRLIHHAHFFYDENAKSVGLMSAYKNRHPEDTEPGFTGDEGLPKWVLGPWFPGQDGSTLYPPGVGAKIKAGSYFVMQVHYALYNKVNYKDHTKVAIWLAHEPIQKERQSVIIKNETFTVPANDSHFVVEASKKFDQAITVYSMLPHMHQLGRDFLVNVVRPGEAPSCMVDAEWDFNHQNQFVYQKPISLPAGSTIKTRAIYDNSELNPNQFNHPVKDVIWGEAADQEMMLTMVAYSLDNQFLTPKAPNIRKILHQNGILKIIGSRIQPGAYIEINGAFAMDSTVQSIEQPAAQTDSVVSLADWKKLAHRKLGGKISFVVVNPDGGKSHEITL